MDNKFYIYVKTYLYLWLYGGPRGGGGGVGGVFFDFIECFTTTLGVGGGGVSIIRLGSYWFTYTFYLIIIYMSNIEAI